MLALHRGKNYLKQHNIPYKDINVAGNREAIDEIVRLTGRWAVPVIVCGKDVMSGSNETRLDQMIQCARNVTEVP